MSILELISASASVATALGVLLAGWQIHLAKRQAGLAFEDDLTRQYRAIIQRIPVHTLLGSSSQQSDDGTSANSQLPADVLSAIYQYVDLCNEQVFLRMEDRVSTQTWFNWCDGMQSNFAREPFKSGWQEIKRKALRDFTELRYLEMTKFATDPRDWPFAWPAKLESLLDEAQKFEP